MTRCPKRHVMHALARNAGRDLDSLAPTSQEPGIGFPIARIIVVFWLAVGAAVEMTIGIR